MKKILLYSALLMFSACTNQGDNEISLEKSKDSQEEIQNDTSSDQSNEEEVAQSSNDIKSKYDPKSILIGTWTGEMSGKTLKIVIKKVEGNRLYGYNVLGTNKRNLDGTFTVGIWDQPFSHALDATLNEPGDDKWDGVFTIKFVGYDDMDEDDDGLISLGNMHGVEAMGNWKSNNGKMNKDFHLSKE